MRSKSEILQEHYGTGDPREALTVMMRMQCAESGPLSLTTNLKLPYEAPRHLDIPSINEIETAMMTSRLTLGAGLFDVCRVGMTVIKRSGDPKIVEEAENLLFLQAKSQVRTPKVYAVFELSNDLAPPCYYLVMEFIEGETLDYSKWIGLSEEDRTKVCSKLADQLSLLRSVPSEGYYGRVHNQSWKSHRLIHGPGGAVTCGPYYTYEDCIESMYTGAELQRASSNLSKDLYSEDYAALAESKRTLMACNGRKPTLTHLDTALKNIII